MMRRTKKLMHFLPLDGMDKLGPLVYADTGIMDTIFCYICNKDLRHMTFVGKDFTSRIINHCLKSSHRDDFVKVATLSLKPIDAQTCKEKLCNMGFATTGSRNIEYIDSLMNQPPYSEDMEESIHLLKRPHNGMELQCIEKGFNPSHADLLPGYNGEQSTTAVLGRCRDTDIRFPCISRKAVSTTLSMSRGETGEAEPRVEFTMETNSQNLICFNGYWPCHLPKNERMLSVVLKNGGIVSLWGYAFAYEIVLSVRNALVDNGCPTL